MSGIVFKQRYNPRAGAKSAGLNAAHLQYIATRPGTVYNPGCGFGLWGCLPEHAMEPPGNIQRLDHAQEVLRQASQQHTIYRAVISVGAADAANLGLYDRQRWQELTAAQLPRLAQRMGMDARHFCWLASFHQAKGHPHIHLMYWDNGDQPRSEYMPPGRFEQVAEQIRADWNRELFGEEIQATRAEQQESRKELRQQLRAMCLEANPFTAMDLAKLLANPALDELANGTRQLMQALPATGSLKYRYLPPRAKEAVDALVEQALQLPDCRKMLEQYLQATDRLSKLYGNGETTAAANREKAMGKLRTELGNGIMDAIRQELRQAEEQFAPSSYPELVQICRQQITAELIRAQPHYKYALRLLPTERVPNAVLLEDREFRAALHSLVEDVTSRNPLLRVEISGCIRRLASAADDPKAASRELHREVNREIRRLVLAELRQDMGYDQEAHRTHAAAIVQNLFRLLCQHRGQAEAQLHTPRPQPGRQRSREAIKNRRAKNAQRGNWEQEME